MANDDLAATAPHTRAVGVPSDGHGQMPSVFETVVTHARDALLLTEAHGELRITYANPAFEILTGFRADQAVGRPLGDFLDDIDPAEVERAARALFAGHGTEVEVTCRRADGSRFRGEVALTPVFHGGAAVGLVVVKRDVTMRWTAEQQVIETLESISDAYFAVDADRRFTYVNAAAERAWGRDRADLLGRRVYDCFPELPGDEFDAVYRRVFETRSPAVHEGYYAPMDLWAELRAFPLPDGGICAYFRDMSERRAIEAEREQLLEQERSAREVAEAAQRTLAYQASHHPLTGLLNREELRRRLSDLLNTATTGAPTVVLFLDLDRFKLVNDSLGHAAGDELLRRVAKRLTRVVRRTDIVAHLSGDEFVVALPGTTPEQAEWVAERIRQAVCVPMDVGGRRLVTTASIGIAQATARADVSSLLRDADVALYRAKASGRDASAWYDDEARRNVVERMELEADLRHAVDQGQLLLHYQPAFDLRTGAPFGPEALVRWRHPARGTIAPGVFIPVAEETGLIHAIGEWVVREAAADSLRWDEFPSGPQVWVNASTQQLIRPGFADTLRTQLQRIGVEPRALGIEVTESSLADISTAPEELRLLSSMGVALAVDDFGTGYSSLARLRHLPVDVIKIDRSFVHDLDTDRGRATIGAIVDLAHAMGALTTAEGVEEVDHLRALAALGCDSAAGFLLAPPVPRDEVRSAIEAGSEVLAAELRPGIRPAGRQSSGSSSKERVSTPSASVAASSSVGSSSKLRTP